MYQLIFDKEFKKDLNKLDKQIRDRVLKKIFKLEKFPELGKRLIGINLWSLRVGKLRVIYKIEHNKLKILVLEIEHRKSVYKFDK